MDINNVLIGILSTIGIGWIIWVSTSLIALLKSNRSEDVTDLKEAFKAMENRMTATMETQETRVSEALARQDLRQDNFFKTEIQELKSIIHKDGG
jgi:hypothetical protein